MGIALIILHLIVCVVLVGVVLLQSGRGAEMGAAFGGSSQTLFGGRGGATFLSKVTVGAAVLFMLTSLGLSVLSRERSVASSLMDVSTGAADNVPKKAADAQAESAGDAVATDSSTSTNAASEATEEKSTAPETASPPPAENLKKEP